MVVLLPCVMSLLKLGAVVLTCFVEENSYAFRSPPSAPSPYLSFSVRKTDCIQCISSVMGASAGSQFKLRTVLYTELYERCVFLTRVVAAQGTNRALCVHHP